MTEVPTKNSKGKRRKRLPWLQAEPTEPNKVQAIACPPWLKKNEKYQEKSQAKNISADSKTAMGQSAELAAEQWLTSQGLRLVIKNFRCRGGEIDLIMADGTTAVIVEVRARSNSSHGHAAETVYGLKQHKVSKAAKLWWAMCGSQYFLHLRFDVVAFDGDEAPKWFKNAWQIPA